MTIVVGTLLNRNLNGKEILIFFHLIQNSKSARLFSFQHRPYRVHNKYVQQFIDNGEENNHIQTRKIVLGHSIPLRIEIFAWRGFLARHYSDKRIFACCSASESTLTTAIMPESKSRQKPKDYKEDTSDLIKCLRKQFPDLKHQEVQDKLRRADNNELCLPERWRVSLKSSF